MYAATGGLNVKWGRGEHHCLPAGDDPVLHAV